MIGFNKFFRGRFLLLKDKQLTYSEYIVWDFCYSVLADWDKRHEKTYATFDYTNAEIAHFLACHPTTISRTMASLIKKKFISIRPNGLHCVEAFEVIDGFLEDMRSSAKPYDVLAQDGKKRPKAFLVRYDLARSISKTVAEMHREPDLPKEDLFGNTIDNHWIDELFV